MDAQSAKHNAPKPGLLRQAWDKLQQAVEADRKKWGGMTAGAMGRLGLAELRELFSPGGNIAQQTPYGMYGTLTPGEVGAARDGDANVWRLNEHALPSPGELADRRASPHGQEHGDEHRRGHGHGM